MEGYNKSQGKPARLRDIFSKDLPKDFNWKDYSIIRIPTNYFQKALWMLLKSLDQGDSSCWGYQMEFGACFTRDSQGFFKRTLIEACVANEPNEDNKGILSKEDKLVFEAKLMGDKDKNMYLALTLLRRLITLVLL